MKVDKTNMNQLNPAISITRVVAMFLIIFCHLIQYYDGGRFSNLSHVLNLGVMVFSSYINMLFYYNQVK